LRDEVDVEESATDEERVTADDFSVSVLKELRGLKLDEVDSVNDDGEISKENQKFLNLQANGSHAVLFFISTLLIANREVILGMYD